MIEGYLQERMSKISSEASYVVWPSDGSSGKKTGIGVEVNRM